MDYAKACFEDHSQTLEERISRDAIRRLYDLPLPELLFRAHSIHREHWNPLEVRMSTLVSVKTGACPEDCAYCAQSSRYEECVPYQPMMKVEEVLETARAAKIAGSTRLCMGASGRNPREGREFEDVLAMIRGVKALGMEACVTLGMLSDDQARRLKEAGLDFYNHNLDTSPEYYANIISTRTYKDRLDTLERVRAHGIRVCSGGILGMGEAREDRVGLLHALANLSHAPDSLPINRLMPMPGTPLAEAEPLDDLEFVRTVAVARLLFPATRIRLAAGRVDMAPAVQLLCFFAGANSVFAGEKLLTAPGPGENADQALFASLGLKVDVRAYRLEGHSERL